MPPKIKIQKQDIITAAVNLVREQGESALNARNIASSLNCSTQPVFSNFATMEELRSAVIEAAETLCDAYITREVEKAEYPPYKASGMAYIRFAKEETELFKLLYIRDRSSETIPEETAQNSRMERIVHENTGLEGDDTRLFHLEMWAYVHGIATMTATGFCHLDRELISKMLTDAYLGMKKHYGLE